MGCFFSVWSPGMNSGPMIVDSLHSPLIGIMNAAGFQEPVTAGTFVERE